ncbi:MAG: hypothetical protein JWP97_239 [Labilithrix sp.]|nr:hypothetical protein [Labilithrix sp.]
MIPFAAAAVGLLTAAVQCNVPDLPPGPQALPTRVGLVRGAFLRVPEEPFDHAALVASLRATGFDAIVIESAADAAGEHVAERVALAVELQATLAADVFVGTYRDPSPARSMAALLQPDTGFASCYPGGPALDPASAVLDKLTTCSADVSTKIAAALGAASASPRIGCFIAPAPELVDTLDEVGRAKLARLFHEGAAACTKDQRFVGVSSLLGAPPRDPTAAGVLFRTALQGSGVGLLMLQDGVGTFDAPARRGVLYYQGLRNALADREPAVAVWANVEAFACAGGTCATSHPADRARYLAQLCAARQRVDGIVTTEYLQDLSERSFLIGAPDAAPDADGGLVEADDGGLDPAAQLRADYLEWADSGASCK